MRILTDAQARELQTHIMIPRDVWDKMREDMSLRVRNEAGIIQKLTDLQASVDKIMLSKGKPKKKSR